MHIEFNGVEGLVVAAILCLNAWSCIEYFYYKIRNNFFKRSVDTV